MRKSLTAAAVVATLGLGISVPAQASPSTTASVVTTRVSVSVKPRIVHTGSPLTFYGRAEYDRGDGWYGVNRGTVGLQYQLKGTTSWYTLTPVKATTGLTGKYSLTINWPLKTSARVRAKLYGNTKIAPAWSTSTYVLRVPNDVVIGVTPGAFCAPGGAKGITWSYTYMTCKKSVTDDRNRWRS
jgi:hypothetical protein